MREGIIGPKTEWASDHPLVVMRGRQRKERCEAMEPNRAAQFLAKGYD